jgi:hypothetical protein
LTRQLDAAQYPFLLEHAAVPMTQRSGDVRDDLEFGVELILDELEALLAGQ